MNARDNTPLRAKIADRLAAGIAKAIGKGDTPSIVVKELNAMRTDGQVECEQRGKKKELVYWLAVPLDVAAGSVEPAPPLPPATISEVMLPPGVRHGTRAAQIYRVLPLYGAKPMTARQIAKATGATIGLISPTLSGMVKAGQISRVLADPCEAYGYTRLPPAGGDSEGGETDVKTQSAEIPPPIPPQIPPPQYDPRSVAFDATARLEAEKDEEYSLLGLLADIRDAAGDPEGKLMQDELVEHIRAIYDLGEAHKRACLAWESAMMAAVGEDGVNDALKKIVDLQNKICMKDAELFKQSGAVVELRNLLAEERTARMALQEQVEELQREAMRGASLLSGSDRYTAAGYLVRASKRKPRALQAADKAREAALGAIRAGAARAEVFALVPVGHARRGAEWRSA